MPEAAQRRGFAAIGLVQPKWEANVGGVLRAAQCYGASLIVIEGKRFDRQAADTTKAWRHTPVLSLDDVMLGCSYSAIPVAVELCDNAEPLPSYIHPERAYYIFGPEDGSVPRRVLDRCAARVQVPTRFCMNLAATVNVVLYDRMAKRVERSAVEVPDA